MATKGIKIALLGDDSPLRQKLDAMQAKGDELKERLSHFDIKADDSDAKYKLARLSLSADKLKEKLDSQHITIRGMDKASLELLRLEAQADRLNRKLGDEGSSRGGIFSSLKGLVSSSALRGGESGAESGGGLLDVAGSPVGIAGIAVALSTLPALIGAGLTGGVGALGYMLGNKGLSTIRGDKQAVAAAQFTVDHSKKPTAAELHALDQAQQKLNQDTKGWAGQFAKVGQQFQPLVHQVSGFVHSLAGPLAGLFKAAIPGIRQFITALEPAIRQAIPELTQVIKAARPIMKDMGHDFGILLLAAVRAMRGMSLAFKDSQVVIDAVVKTVSLLIEGLGYLIGAIAIKVGGTLRGLEQDFWSVVHTVEHVVSGIKSSFSGLPGALFSIGESVISGLLHGLEAAAGGVLSFVSGLASKVAGLFGSILKIGSPSRVFHEYGLNIGQGLALGIDHSQALVNLSTARLARGVVTGFGAHSIASAAHRAAAMGGHAGGQPTLVIRAEGDDLLKAIVKALRYDIRETGGGNVQNHLGWGNA